MAKSAKPLELIEKAVVYLTYLLVSLMVINTATGVFFRFILNNALSWTDELGRYMMIWVGFFGCYLAARDNSHVGVEMFVQLFKPGARKVFHIAARLVVIAFLVIILAKSGEQLSLLGIQKSSALEIPMAVPYSAVTFGIFMMLIENLAHLFRLIKAPAAPTVTATATKSNGK
jgi:TRAP-type C4-dicarboxylate transport system permease small subunit